MSVFRIKMEDNVFASSLQEIKVAKYRMPTEDHRRKLNSNTRGHEGRGEFKNDHWS
jgi:hypothetical protein